MEYFYSVIFLQLFCHLMVLQASDGNYHPLTIA
jgi:hypothetical protein